MGDIGIAVTSRPPPLATPPTLAPLTTPTTYAPVLHSFKERYPGTTAETDD